MNLGNQITPFSLALFATISLAIFGLAIYKYKTTFTNKKLKYRMYITAITAVISILTLLACLFYKTQHWNGWFNP